MRQAFRQLFKATGAMPTQTTFTQNTFNYNALFMGGAVAGASYFMW
jgi:hypothetical protein